ncbi:hypothetical protein VrSk94_23580 [Vibrio rotiferianus]
MVNLVLGVLLGFCLTIWYVAIDLRFGFDSNVSINVVIAIATVIATAIHFDSQRKQRKDRIWDMNKNVLLDLAHALSEVIEATEDEIHNIHCQLEGDEQIEVKPYVFKNIKEKVDYALSVYKSLMDCRLIELIQHYSEHDKKITYQVNFEDLEHLDAYESMLVEHKKLYAELIRFMGKVSGVKNT